MSKQNEFNLVDFKPEGKTIEELTQQQEKLLTLFEQWETTFHSLIANNKKWKSLSETKKTLEMMKLIENLWKESKKMSARLTNASFDDVSIIQYRMELFLERRRKYRENLETNEKELVAEILDVDNKILERSRINEQPLPVSCKKSEKPVNTTQSALDSFFSKEK